MARPGPSLPIVPIRLRRSNEEGLFPTGPRPSESVTCLSPASAGYLTGAVDNVTEIRKKLLPRRTQRGLPRVRAIPRAVWAIVAMPLRCIDIRSNSSRLARI
jgi:hypothetical protein